MDLDLEMLDKVVDGYVAARRAGGPKRAVEALRFAVYNSTGHRHAGEAFRKIGCLARSYAKIYRMMSHPRCGIELPLALSTVCICGASIFLASRGAADDENFILPVIMTLNGIFMVMYIVREIVRKWCEFRVLAAIYEELAEFAGREMTCA
ncbi:MAG: hypothetical protein HYV06_09925 [Deltaproteobacteria bacterium]|nr:hypothetical protein [Deltaproteobacteria bacterium]